jgi:predicted nucleic acid-binding Zn ribbon protein
MSLNSINNILSVLEAQAKWHQQPFLRLLKCWNEVVGTVIAAHTQPLSIQRDVLHVATSSAAWAQNLTFERRRLLLKLNERLPTPLVDIHFSTFGWQSAKNTTIKQQTPSKQEHPSYLGDNLTVSPDDMSTWKPGDDKISDDVPTAKDVNAAFRNWAKAVQARTHNLPLCPQCQCPTPNGELQRWGVCAICAAKQF